MRIHAFDAIRPGPARAADVASPPYDVVTREEAAATIADRPSSFLRVVRSDAELPADVDPGDARVYARARDNLRRFLRDGVLAREGRPAIYLYRLVREGRSQTGVAACVRVDEYEAGVVRQHEGTRPEKVADRARHIAAVAAHAEPVLLAYRDRPDLAAEIAADTARPPLFDFIAADGVRHTVWTAPDPARYVEAFAAVPCAYIADGHHRTASAAVAAREVAGAERDRLPAVLFPASELRILPYNRVVSDLGGLSADAFLAELRALGRLAPPGPSVPPARGSFAFYLGGRWHVLELGPDSIEGADPVRALDATTLQERVLGPVLGIADQRTDERIDFVGGARGAEELEARVDSGRAALAISILPPSVDELMAVSDAGRAMPPKSTWFEPKLASGLFVHALD